MKNYIDKLLVDILTILLTILFTLFIILCITGIVIGIDNIIKDIRTYKEEYDGEYTLHTIMPNETLWEIASDIDGDTRYIVYTIKKDNNIADCGGLQVGQMIKIRVEY